MRSTDEQIYKYNHYLSLGHGVYSVTLSTYVKANYQRHRTSRTSDRWRAFWDHHFIYSVRRSLPFRATDKLDHDWTLEESPDGYFHYHGMLAVHAEFKRYVWTSDGLSKKLSRRLDSFQKTGAYRAFRINNYLVEPVERVSAWALYSTKENPFYLNTNVAH